MLRLQVTSELGQSIEVAARDAVNLATRTGCIVDMRFNGVMCIAYPLGDWQQMVREFHKDSRGLKPPHHMAFARAFGMRAHEHDAEEIAASRRAFYQSYRD